LVGWFEIQEKYRLSVYGSWFSVQDKTKKLELKVKNRYLKLKIFSLILNFKL
jgi:hypothetical protein